jgi:hypothetical protein
MFNRIYSGALISFVSGPLERAIAMCHQELDLDPDQSHGCAN